MDILYLFLIVFSFIFLGMSAISFLSSLILGCFCRSRKGWFVPLIYLSFFAVLFLFWAIYPGGAEAWMTVLLFTICLTVQFVWIGKHRNLTNRLLKWAFGLTLLTNGLLLSSVIVMNVANSFQLPG